MAWTAVITYAVGDPWTASAVNTYIRDNLNYLVNSSGQMQPTGTDHYFGAGAAGGTGTRVHVGSLGDAANAYVLADGSPANVGLHLRQKGTGSVVIETTAGAALATIDSNGTFTSKRASDGATIFATELTDGGTASTQVYIRVGQTGGEALQRVSLGAVDSGGTGFRLLRVPN